MVEESKTIDGMVLPKDNKLGPNCGITAVAVMAGTTYAEAERVIRSLGRFTRRWKGGTNHELRREALKILGHELIDIEVPRCTMQTFVRKYARPGVRYMVRTSGHVQVVKDGYLLDQLGCYRVTGLRPQDRKIVTRVSILKEE